MPHFGGGYLAESHLANEGTDRYSLSGYSLSSRSMLWTLAGVPGIVAHAVVGDDAVEAAFEVKESNRPGSFHGLTAGFGGRRSVAIVAAFGVPGGAGCKRHRQDKRKCEKKTPAVDASRHGRRPSIREEADRSVNSFRQPIWPTYLVSSVGQHATQRECPPPIPARRPAGPALWHPDRCPRRGSSRRREHHHRRTAPPTVRP